MSYNKPIHESENPNAAPPPSYEEAIEQASAATQQSAPPFGSPPMPARPLEPQGTHYQHSNVNPPVPSQGSSSSHQTQSLYTNNPNLPFTYPRGHFCKKCKNTGFKDHNKPCTDCWQFFVRKEAYNPNPNLSFRYPKGYFCKKCMNSGVKRKNGLTCQDCYERFAPRNNTMSSYMPFTSYTNYAPPPMPGPGISGAPIRLLPGDPRLGGVLCGKCRGSGRTMFFLDEELCRLCGGVGRLFNAPPQGYR